MKTIAAQTQEEIAEEVRGWYESSREIIPQLDNAMHFANFVGTSSAMANVSSKSKSLSFHFIINPKAPTAYIDQTNKVIALPGWYFSEEALSKLASVDETKSPDLESISLALTNGSQVHEGLHAWLTPAKLENFIEYMGTAGKKLQKECGNVLNAVMNVTEDLYIEMIGHHEYDDSIMQFVDMKNNVLFAEKDILDAYEHLHNAKDDKEKLDGRIQFFTCLKNVRFTNLAYELARKDAFVRRLMSQTSWTRDYSFRHIETRAFEMLGLTNLILEGISPEAASEVNMKMDGGEKGTRMVEMDPDLFEGELELSEEEMEKLEAIAVEYKEATEIEQMMMKMDNEKSIVKPSSDDLKFGRFITNYVDNIFTIPDTHETLAPSKSNYGFLALVRQLRTRNHTPGAARKSGTNIVGSRLYRIGTDQKIFARKDMVEEKEHKVQVAILIDASGSMGHMYVDVVTESAEIFKSFRKLNIPVIAYAHTGAPKDSSQPTLYRIASSQMNGNNTDVDARFTRALSINLTENYDGIIIDSVSVMAFKNTPDTTRKILFVLSDGEPAGVSYRGPDADAHTKRAIAKARESGISVIAISLVPSVVRKNNEIYGRNMNVDASANMKAKFEELILRLQEEGNL